MGRFRVAVVLFMSIILVACGENAEKTAAIVPSEGQLIVMPEKSESLDGETEKEDEETKNEKKMSKEEKQLVEEIQVYMEEYLEAYTVNEEKDFNPENFKKLLEMVEPYAGEEYKRIKIEAAPNEHNPYSTDKYRRNITIVRILDDTTPSQYGVQIIEASALYWEEKDIFDKDGKYTHTKVTVADEEYRVQVVRAETTYGFGLIGWGDAQYYDK